MRQHVQLRLPEDSTDEDQGGDEDFTTFSFRHAQGGCLDGGGDNNEILAGAHEDYAYQVRIWTTHSAQFRDPACSECMIQHAASDSTVDDEGQINAVHWRG